MTFSTRYTMPPLATDRLPLLCERALDRAEHAERDGNTQAAAFHRGVAERYMNAFRESMQATLAERAVRNG